MMKRELETRRYFGRIVLYSMLLYPLTLVAAISIALRNPDSIWLIPAIILSMGPALALLLTTVNYISNLDEMERRIHLESAAISLGIIIILSFSYGLLEALAQFPHFSILFIFPLGFVGYGISYLFVRRRYR